MYEEINLSHYSHNDTLEPYSQEQKPQSERKPRGLWISVEGEYGWKEWGTDNEYGCFDYRFEVELVAGHNVLITDDLLGFHATYRRAPFPGREYPIEYISWVDVADEYQGIIIPTYHFEFRFDTRVSYWYYGWDCACGCIWDATAIASVSLAEQKETPCSSN